MPTRAEFQIEIAAPIEVVWRVMTDLPGYAAWNPFVIRVDGVAGEPMVGTPMRLLVRWADGSTTRSGEVFERLDAPTDTGDGSGAQTALLQYGFRGPLHALGLVRGSRMQSLVQAPGGPTRYRSIEDFTGLLVRFVPLARVQDGFERQARALQQRAEALARGA